MNLGISGQALGEIMSFEQIVDVAEKYGITHFELWPCNVPGSGFGYRDREIAVIQEIVHRRKIQIDCVTVEAAFCEAAVETPEIYIDILKGTIDAAEAVGAKLVNHYCYFICLDETPDYERLDAYWAEPLRYAKERGITLVLENEAHDVTRHPETVADIVEHFDSPFFRTNLDAANYFHASEEGFPKAYEILKPYIGYVHLKNSCLHRDGADQPEENLGAPMSGLYEGLPVQYATLPEGSVNIAGLLEALIKDGNYDGTCTLEPHTMPQCVEEFYRVESSWLRRRGYF